MNHYKCPTCGQTSYSAAREADMVDPGCPYCAHNETASVFETEAAKPETTTDYTTLPRAMQDGYICDNCDQWFSDPLRQLDYHGFMDGIPEESYVSPCCYYSFMENYRCLECGSNMDAVQAISGLCTDCEGAAAEKLTWLLCNEFSAIERKYLKEEYEWPEIR